jgi:predicted DNA-binding protein
MQQVTIRMPDEYLAGIEQIANSTGLKKSDITRMAIKNYIEDFAAKKKINHYSMAKHLIGVVDSGISDLGQNHRNYLVQKIKGKK